MSDQQQNRFVTRPMKLRELIWAFRAQRGDIEAMGFLLESRRLDPAFDVMDLEGDELLMAIQEMGDAAEQGASVDKLLASVRVS